jgi:hypothetical protein
MSERIKNIVAQGSIPEFENDGDDLDRIYLTVRGKQIALGLNGGYESSLVILPESLEVREFVTQTESILGEIGLTSSETLLVPESDYFLDKAIEGSLELVADRLCREDRNILWPYANTHLSDSWMEKLSIQGFRISNALPKKEYKSHQTRSGWGRRISDPDKESFPERYGIPYPISYIAQGQSELIEAYNKVASLTENGGVYLKLSASAGGFGVARVESEDGVKSFYDSVRQSGSLYLFGDPDNELDIEVQEEISGIRGFGSLQYLGNRLETPGGISVQLLDGPNWSGNKFNVLNGKLAERSLDIFEKFSYGMHEEHPDDFYGWGGIDLGIVGQGESPDLVVVENNWGRVTGAHPGIYFAKALGAADRPFMVRKLKPPKVDAAECWNLLKNEGLAYDVNTKRGAVPIPWVRNVDAFVFVAGESDYEITETTDRIMNLMVNNGYH